MRKIGMILVMVVMLTGLTGCDKGGDEPISATEYDLLDTVCTISIYDVKGEAGKRIIEEAFELCRHYENLLSKTVEGSDIYNLNNANGEAVEISEETYGLLEDAIYYGELSNGKFDVTIGRLTNLWNFTSDAPTVPYHDDIVETMNTIDYRGITLEEKDGKFYARVSNGESEIDLGGIAKGYIADRISDFMNSEGVEKCIINLGGNVVALGEKAEGVPWKIGIERPFTDRKEIVGYVNAANKTVVTSGIYERMFIEDGLLYHHILDVHTGYPSQSDVEAVSLVADAGKSMDCDALSTICLVIGKDAGLRLIESIEGVEAGFITTDGEIYSTKNMGLVIEEQ